MDLVIRLLLATEEHVKCRARRRYVGTQSGQEVAVSGAMPMVEYVRSVSIDR